MSALTGQAIQNSYKDVLQVSNSNSGVDATLRAVSDGEGTDSALKLSTTKVQAQGFLIINGTAYPVQLETRPDLDSSYPVLVVRPTNAAVGILDVVPNGTPSEKTGDGYAWIDICDTDLITAGTTSGKGLHLGIRSDRVDISSRHFTGGAPLPLTLQIGTNIRMKMDATGLAFNTSTPIAQPILATGAGHTVDDVITVLQNLGLVKQS